MFDVDDVREINLFVNILNILIVKYWVLLRYCYIYFFLE